MADETDDFEQGALTALANEGLTAETATAPTEQTPAEQPAIPAEVQALAAELAKLGATPEQAKAALADLNALQTDSGRAEYWRRFIESPQGQQIRDTFGRDYLANVLSQPDAMDRLEKMAASLGHQPQRRQEEPNLEDLTPEQREILALKKQLGAVGQELRAIKGATEQTQQALGQRTAQEMQQAAFVDWARSTPGLPEKAYATVVKRAAEKAQLDPQRYGSRDGFRRACQDAYAEKTADAALFAPAKRPTSLRSGGGGGAVPASNFDFSKMSLSQRISAAADDWAAALKGEE